MLRVEGKLTNGDAEMLSRTVGQIENATHITIDLSGVTYIDSDGVSTLRNLDQEGVELTGADFFIQTIIDAYGQSNK